MPHVKTQLRNGIEQRLRDAVPALASVVSAIRLERAIQSKKVPLASVEVSDGGIAVGGNTASTRPVRRDMGVTVTLAMQENLEDVEGALEELQVEVEAALRDASLILKGVNDWAYAGSTTAGLIAAASVAALSMNYTCWLSTPAGSADTII